MSLNWKKKLILTLISSLPDWAKKVIHGDFEYLNNMWYIIFTATTELKKIRSGYLLKEILDHFTSKILKTLSPNRTLWMYFAHDITIANMLNSLGLFKVSWTTFESNSCLINTFYFDFSYTFRHMHRVSSSNFIEAMAIHTYKFSTENRWKKNILHL